MNIGVYGDSYADTPDLKMHTAWFNILANMLSKDKVLMRNYTKDVQSVNVDNYGKGGSSLYFSYKNFLSSSHKYDLVIFLATEPHRYPIKFTSINGGGSYYITSVPHVEQLEIFLDHVLTEEEKIFLTNLKGWFNASNHDYNKDISNIILENIEQKHPNVIIYPCFSESFTSDRYKRYKLDYIMHPLHNFWHRQLELFGIEPDTFTAMEKDTLSGHLTPEFNEYFAKVLFSKLKTGKWDHTGFFDVTIKLPKTHYYKNWD